MVLEVMEMVMVMVMAMDMDTATGTLTVKHTAVITCRTEASPDLETSGTSKGFLLTCSVKNNRIYKQKCI